MHTHKTDHNRWGHLLEYTKRGEHVEEWNRYSYCVGKMRGDQQVWEWILRTKNVRSLLNIIIEQCCIKEYEMCFKSSIRRSAPNKSTIMRLTKKFEETGSVCRRQYHRDKSVLQYAVAGQYVPTKRRHTFRTCFIMYVFPYTLLHMYRLFFVMWVATFVDHPVQTKLIINFCNKSRLSRLRIRKLGCREHKILFWNVQMSFMKSLVVWDIEQ